MGEIDLGTGWNSVIQMPVIVGICMLIGKIIKTTSKNPVVITKIPIILAALGGILGIVHFVFIAFIAAKPVMLNPITLLLSGIIAGWSSVGVHQTAKQTSEAETFPYDKEIE